MQHNLNCVRKTRANSTIFLPLLAVSMSIILPGVQTIISAPRFSSAIWMRNERKTDVKREKLKKAEKVARTLGAFIQPKLPKFSKQGQMVQNISRKSGNC